MPITPEDERELTVVRLHLLRDRPPPLQPEQGNEAFRNHKLLAAAVHQASKLNQRKLESETGAWVGYMTSYFPPPRNGKADAEILWTDWRTSLLKRGAPGPKVLVTHGQSVLHWHRDSGRLCINLEDMWADFEQSIDAFIEFLRSDDERRTIALTRAEKFEIDVITIPMAIESVPVSGTPGPMPVASAYVGPPSEWQAPPPRK